MIDKLIQEELYEEALSLLMKKDDDESIYKRIVCLYGLKRFDEAFVVSSYALENTEKFYYDVLCLHISILLELEKDDVALKLIEEELEMPYIPYQYDNFLNETYNMLYKKKLQNSKSFNIYDTCSDEEIKDILIKEREKDILLIALDQLHKRNIRLYLAELKYILKARDYKNEIKVIILELLAEQGIDNEVEMYTNGKTIEVSPTSLTPLMEQLAIDEILDIIEEKVTDKDVSLFNICQDLLIAYLASVYPLEVEEDEYNTVACALYYAALTNLNIEKDLEEICKLFEVKSDFVYPYYEEICNLSTF